MLSHSPLSVTQLRSLLLGPTTTYYRETDERGVGWTTYMQIIWEARRLDWCSPKLTAASDELRRRAPTCRLLPVVDFTRRRRRLRRANQSAKTARRKTPAQRRAFWHHSLNGARHYFLSDATRTSPLWNVVLWQRSPERGYYQRLVWQQWTRIYNSAADLTLFLLRKFTWDDAATGFGGNDCRVHTRRSWNAGPRRGACCACYAGVGHTAPWWGQGWKVAGHRYAPRLHDGVVPEIHEQWYDEWHRGEHSEEYTGGCWLVCVYYLCVYNIMCVSQWCS